MSNRIRPSQQIDWLLFNLRWLLLVAAGIIGFFTLTARGQSPVPVAALLLAAAGYNLLVMMTLTLGVGTQAVPFITLLFDSALAIAFYHSTGRSQSPLIWLALFPILTAALRFGLASSLIVALIVLSVEAVVMVGLEGTAGLVTFVFDAALLLVAAGLTGGVGERVRQLAVRQIQAEREAEDRKIRAERERARAIFEMASLVSATLSYEKVLEAALDLGAMGVENLSAASAQMVSAVLLFSADGLSVATARRLSPADMKIALAARSGVLHAVIQTAAPQHIAEPYRDPELSHFVGFRGCRSLLALPLHAGFETYGVALYGHPRVDFFDLDHVELLQTICTQVVAALQNAQLYRKLMDEKERIVAVEDDARKKLARDLHDGPTQSIAAIAMRVNFARRLLERDPKQAADELFKIEDLARRTTKEIRHMLFTLRPLILESQGLTAALRQLAEKMRETQTVSVEADAGIDDRLEKNQQGVLFYIVEEAVNNARKHAEAQHVWVRLKLREPDVLGLEIQDDGVGFNLGTVDAAYDQRGSLGMVNMRERAELVSGVLHIDTAEGKGTQITLLVPLSEEARDRLRG